LIRKYVFKLNHKNWTPLHYAASFIQKCDQFHQEFSSLNQNLPLFIQKIPVLNEKAKNSIKKTLERELLDQKTKNQDLNLMNP